MSKMQGYSFGNLFETFIITDFLKRFLHFGQMSSLYYMRTRDGLEVDLVVEWGEKLHLFEIKGTMTVFPKHASTLLGAERDLEPAVKSSTLISLSPGERLLGGEGCIAITGDLFCRSRGARRDLSILI